MTIVSAAQRELKIPAGEGKISGFQEDEKGGRHGHPFLFTGGYNHCTSNKQTRSRVMGTSSRAFGWWLERADGKGVKETARHKPLKMLPYVGEYT